MPRTPLALLACLTVAMTGCGASTAVPGAMNHGDALGAASMAQRAAEARGVDANGMVKLSDPSGYVLQAITAWNKTDVAKVTLRLYKKSGTTWTDTGLSKDVANDALASAVTLQNLKLATEYKVVGMAYDGASARIDNQVEADNAVTFTTPSVVANAAGDTVNDSTITFTAPIKLMNKSFAGSATSASGVAVTNGAITSTTAAESF